MMDFCWHLNATHLQTAKALTCWWSVNQLHLFLVKWRECNITYTVFHLRPAKDQIIFLVLLLNSYISENSVNLMSQCVFRVHDVEVGPLQELSYHGTCFSFSVLTWFPSANPIPLIGELWQSPSSPVGSISSVRWPHAGNRCICNRHHSQ